MDCRAIEAIHPVIRPRVRRTPVIEVGGADFGLAPFPLVLKLELLQHSYGADLVVGGDRYADALAASEAWGAQSGALSPGGRQKGEARAPARPWRLPVVGRRAWAAPGQA